MRHLLFNLLILICFIGCGSDEEEVVGDPEIVKITCDGKTITVEFNTAPTVTQVHYVLANPISLQQGWTYSQEGNLIRIPYPKIDATIHQFYIEWTTGDRTFVNPCR